MTKIYTVWIDEDGTLRSNGYASKSFTTKEKAEAYIDDLKKTKYKNYYVTLWIVEGELD